MLVGPGNERRGQSATAMGRTLAFGDAPGTAGAFGTRSLEDEDYAAPMTETLPDGPVSADLVAGAIAAVFERGAAGAAVLREAAELANSGHDLSVLTLAPQARPPRWGRASGTGPYNVAIQEEAAIELQEAREILGSVATLANFEVLTGCPQPPLASWTAQHEVGLVLLPYHRLTPGGNLFVKRLRSNTSAQVRLVKPARRRPFRPWETSGDSPSRPGGL